jgi:Tol biopolymer transport system component
MNSDNRLRSSIFLTLAISLLVASCGIFEADLEPGDEVIIQPDDDISLVTEVLTPVALETEVPPPPAHRASGLILSNSDGTWWIDREGEIQLLIDKSLARFSPDGKWIAYGEEDPATTMDDIWLMEVATGLRKNITNTPGRSENIPFWVPGHLNILLFGSDTEIGRTNSSFPTVVSIDGSGYEILDPDTGGFRAVSPDGETFFYGGYDGTMLLYRWETGTEVFDPSDFDIAVEKLFEPTWSPDGNKIAWFAAGYFLNNETTQLGIVIFDLNTQSASLMHVYEPQGGSEFMNYLVWSPDGEWLAFTTHNEPPATGRAPNLWVIRPDGTDEVYIAEGTVPVWRYDGKYLAFQGLNEESTEEVFLAGSSSWEVEWIDDLPLPERIGSLLRWVTP